MSDTVDALHRPPCWNGNHNRIGPQPNPEFLEGLNLPEQYETLTIRCVKDDYTPNGPIGFSDQQLSWALKRYNDLAFKRLNTICDLKVTDKGYTLEFLASDALDFSKLTVSRTFRWVSGAKHQSIFIPFAKPSLLKRLLARFRKETK